MYLQYAHQKRKSNGCLMMDELYWKLFRSLLYVRHSDIERLLVVLPDVQDLARIWPGFVRFVRFVQHTNRVPNAEYR
jgi:hypothetical protein